MALGRSEPPNYEDCPSLPLPLSPSPSRRRDETLPSHFPLKLSRGQARPQKSGCAVCSAELPPSVFSFTQFKPTDLRTRLELNCDVGAKRPTHCGTTPASSAITSGLCFWFCLFPTTQGRILQQRQHPPPRLRCREIILDRGMLLKFLGVHGIALSSIS